MPEAEHRVAFVVGGWDRAVDLAQALAQADLPLSMVRVSTPLETATTFALGAEARGAGILRRYLGLRGPDGERCLAIVGTAGPAGVVRAVARAVGAVAGDHRAVRAPGVASAWAHQRFRGAVPAQHPVGRGLRRGHARDGRGLEPAAGRLAAALGPALRHGLADDDERVHAFSHLSHVYPSGSSLYTTYVFRLADDPDETLERWRRLKTAASGVIVAHGGTISHQHGVGPGPRPVPRRGEGAARDGGAPWRARARSTRTAMMAPGVLLGED